MNQTVLESVHRILEGHETPPLPPGPQRCSCAVMKKPLSRTAGLERFTHTLYDDVDLVCYLAYEKASKGGREEGPDEPADATLQLAFVGDGEVTKLLSYSDKEEIEAAFLAQDRSEEPDYEPDFEPYDREYAMEAA